MEEITGVKEFPLESTSGKYKLYGIFLV